MRRTVRLGALCTLRAGSAFPQDQQGGKGGSPFIKVSDLSQPAGGKWVVDANNYITEAQARRLKVRLMPPRSVVFAKIGEGLKSERLRVLSVPTAIDNNLMAATATESSCSPDYLYYLLATVGLSKFAHGSALPYLRQSDLESIECDVPPLPTQRAIAEVLGALDDKIAANQRVADSAVALADQLFARDKSSATLEVRAFDQVCTIAGGATPSTKVSDYWDGGIPWATPTDVTGLRAPYLDATARSITDEGLAKCSSALYPVGSILMTSRATIGAFALAKVPVAVNQGFIVAHAREPQAQLWLFHEMRSRVEDFLLYANGATFLELSKSRFKSIEVSWPADLPSVRQFCGEVAPLHDRAHQAMVESAQLAELRDTLLPHLMSGRLTVREAEKHVEAAL